jgi:hypothetical protein
MGKVLLLSLGLAVLAVPAAVKQKVTERTFKLGPGEKSPPAKIADMAWLAGHWTGAALGGTSEEIWSAPRAGAMMGMYRLVRDGKTVFYELCTIVEEKGSLVLRLKHFNADLTGWEEKTKTVDFPLVEIAGGAFHFEGMSFHPQGGDAVTVYLAIGAPGAPAREEAFSYTRAGAGPK